MRISVVLEDVRKVAADLLVVPVFEGAPAKSGEKVGRLAASGALLDKSVGGLLTEHVVEERMTGAMGESFVFRLRGEAGAGRVVLMGVGSRLLSVTAARSLAARSTKIARSNRCKKIVFAMPEKLDGSVSDVTEALAEGAMLGDYRFLKHKDKELKEYAERGIESFSVNVVAKKDVAAAERGVRLGYVCSHATMLARGLVNEPPSVVTPGHLADFARALAAAHPKRVSAVIHDQAALEEMKAGGLLAVARGSDLPPYLIHLTYKPKVKARKRIAIVGKGITFDSGGLSIKPSSAMEDMKIDMAGCAVMLGVISALHELEPSVEVHGISAVCENMPSGKAVRPGDIVRTMSGKTIEVLNTDAEGRVTLADALHYAAELKPDCIIDLATLTGSCMVALGEEYAGLFSNNRKLAARLLASCEREGEPMWELPLPEEYKSHIKSREADLRNTGSVRYGDAIHAALFLQEFVQGRPWAHLDIAGPAHSAKEHVPHNPSGATGFGVRTLIDFIQNLK